MPEYSRCICNSQLFAEYGRSISVVIHGRAAVARLGGAQPLTDFSVNANGPLNLLEATRTHCPEAAFVLPAPTRCAGDAPTTSIVERETRWEIAENHAYYEHGIDETLRIDQSKHSLFGASKVAADIMQEYGHVGIKTAAFRNGCLTGPAHSAAELHGFLAYAVKLRHRPSLYLWL